MADTSVVYIKEDMRGAPAMSAAAGKFILVMDALLVNGWGQETATAFTISSGVATLTIPSGIPHELGAVIAVNCSGTPALSGRYNVTASSATSVSFAVSAPDGTISGTTTVKYAGAGWTKPFAVTNKASYKNAAGVGPQRFLRVNDTAADTVRLYGYNNMTAIETGTGNFGNGIYWYKSMAASANAQRYFAIADSQALIYAPSLSYEYYVTNSSDYSFVYSCPSFFGYTNPSRVITGDPWCSVLSGDTNNSYGNAYVVSLATAQNASYAFVERDVGGGGSAITPYTCVAGLTGSSFVSGNQSTFATFADSPDGRAIAVPTGFSEKLNYTLRAQYPGYLALAAAAPVKSDVPFADRDIVILPDGTRAIGLLAGVSGYAGAYLIKLENWRA